METVQKCSTTGYDATKECSLLRRGKQFHSAVQYQYQLSITVQYDIIGPKSK